LGKVLYRAAIFAEHQADPDLGKHFFFEKYTYFLFK